MTTLDQVRRRLDEIVPREWSNAELQDWIHQGAFEIARRTETLQAIGTLTVPAGVEEIDLPPDLLRVHLMLIQTRPGYARQLEYRDYVASPRNSTPLFFTIWGFPPNLTIWPSSPENQTLFCCYYQTGLTPPAGWDDLLVDYAEYHALRKDRDDRWSDARKLFEQKVNRMIDMTRRWVDAAGQIVDPGGAEFPFEPPIVGGAGWDVSRWDEGRWQ